MLAHCSQNIIERLSQVLHLPGGFLYAVVTGLHQSVGGNETSFSITQCA